MLVHGFVFLLLAAGPPPADGGKARYLVAQVFRVDQPAPPVDKQARGKAVAPKVESEEDLWKEEPEAKPAKKTESDQEAEESEGKDEGWEEPQVQEGAEEPEAEPKTRPLPGKEIPEGPVLTEDHPLPAAPDRKPVPPAPEKPASEAAAKPAEVKPRAVEPPQLENKALSFRLPVTTRQELNALWEKRRLHLAQHDIELARQDLEEWLKLKEELDLRNQYAEAWVLLRQAEQYRKAADLKAWEDTLEAAVAAAPDLPDGRLARAWMWLKKSPGQPGRVVGEIWQALRAFWSDSRWRERFLTNEVFRLLVAFTLAAMLFIAVHLFLRLRFFYHDFSHIFPRGVSRFQSGILLTLLLLVPVLFRWGLITVMLLMASIAFFYGTLRQRAVLLAAVAFLGALPFGLKWVAWRWQAPGWLAEDLVAVVRGPAAEKNLERLRQHLLQNPAEVRVLAVLGDYHKRIGDLQTAEDYLRRAQAADGTHAAIANNLGNVMFLKRDLNSALTFYDQAARLAPNRPEPYYNLSRLYYAALDLEKAKQMRESASRLNEQLVRSQNQRAESGWARDAVMDMPFEQSWLMVEESGPRQAYQRAARQLWRWFGGVLEPAQFSAMATLWLTVLLVLGLAARRWRLSQPCVHCGQPVCRSCDPQLPDLSTCSQCHHLLRRQDVVDARAKIAKEIQVRKYRRRLQRMAQFLTILLPGTGQMIKEHTGRAVPMLVLAALVAVQLAMPGEIMAYPYRLTQGVNWLALAPALILGLLVWSWAVWDVFREKG
jgi:tetratricopeptide (TPR) repeat protein